MFDARRHHRRSIRLRNHDYRKGGVYFVTICTNQREWIFGEIRNGMMGLNDYGCIVADEIRNTTVIRPYVHIDTWVVMPDHMHMLMHIDDERSRDGPTTSIRGHARTNIDDRRYGDGRGMARHAPATATTTNDASSPLRKPTRPSLSATTIDGATRSFGKPQSRSLSTIVGAFKSAVTKRINESRGSDGTVWQRNFHEHIVRDDDERARIERYILRNPRQWAIDTFMK